MPINYVDFGFAGGVRSHVASNPDRSFDPNSTFGKNQLLTNIRTSVCKLPGRGLFLSRKNRYLDFQTYLGDFRIF